MKEIVIKKRTNDYHAQLKDHPEIWDCGDSPQMAIGNLIMSHPDKCKIKINTNAYCF